MAKIVEVYVKTEKLPVDKGTRYELTEPGHICTKKAVRDLVFEAVLPEAQRATVKMLEQLCNETGTELRIYDTCTFTGRIRAQLKQVKKAPTIVYGNSRIEGTAERGQLLSLLK
jgi:hypothetical protein